jgi:hypothetical protein
VAFDHFLSLTFERKYEKEREREGARNGSYTEVVYSSNLSSTPMIKNKRSKAKENIIKRNNTI